MTLFTCSVIFKGVYDEILNSKRFVCSVYSKSLKLYGRKYSKDLILQRQALADIYKIDVLQDFAKFIGKHLYQVLYLMKLQASNLQLYYKGNPGTDVLL